MAQKLRDVILDISKLLENAGMINHRSEARSIVAKMLDRDVANIHPAMENEISDDDYNRIMALAQRRASGEPLQLITGCVGFYNCVLACEKGVFIPRVETELIVDSALKYLSDFPPDSIASVLDLGTGCGAIPIALAISEPRHHYYGVDLSEKAVCLSRSNAMQNNVADKINFIQGDYFEPIRNWDNHLFHLITANPPYIRTDEIPNLARDVKDWDPGLSLDGGADGLSHYRKIAAELHDFLTPDGVAIFEIAPEYVVSLKNILEIEGFEISRIVKDYDNFDRVIDVTFSNAEGNVNP